MINDTAHVSTWIRLLHPLFCLYLPAKPFTGGILLSLVMPGKKLAIGETFVGFPVLSEDSRILHDLLLSSMNQFPCAQHVQEVASKRHLLLGFAALADRAAGGCITRPHSPLPAGSVPGPAVPA